MDWDTYFIRIANVVRQKSKDPSSKIGAVIVDDEHHIISTGFNGHPRGIRELDEAGRLINNRWNDRERKYKFVCHAERNAVDSAARRGLSLKGSTLYLIGFGPPTVPCIECTKTIIQSGIRCVKGSPYKEARVDWKDNLQFSFDLLEEAGVEFIELPPLDQLDRS